MNRREEVVSGGQRKVPREYGSAYGGVASEPVEVRRTTAMRLRGCVLGVAVATMFVVLPTLGRPVGAGEATDHVRTHIDQMYQLVAKTGSTAESREAVQKLADRMFNWNAMAEGALGQHWRERTPPERAEFARLFAEVFERAYLSKIQLADAERFAYLGDTTKDDHAVVRTRITTNNGTVIPVNYRARMTEGGTWRVYDLDVGSVSLVGNYRTQFNSIIGRSSYPDLVNRLKALREQHGGVRSTTIARST
jgi:phospholipid transport system substrate-binding protein